MFLNLSKSLQKLSKMFQDMPQKLSKVFSSPGTIIALVAVIVLIVVLLRTKKIKFNTRLLAFMAITIALSTVLGTISVYKMPQGGSVTLGSMVPILILTFIYGPEVGFLTGFVYGLINLITGPYIMHPIQVLLDYPLPFMLLGTAGYFKNNYVGSAVAIFARFVCHLLSGVVFFASFAGDQNPLIYSIIYNGSYLLPELIITVLVVALLPVKRLRAIASPAN